MTADLGRQWAVVDAFLAASREGDFAGLLAILDPDVVLRADAGAGPLGPSTLVRGAREVIAQAQRFAPLGRFARPVLVNGGPGFLVARDGEPLALMAMTVRDGRITEMDVLADPDRLARLDLTAVLACRRVTAGPGGRAALHRAAFRRGHPSGGEPPGMRDSPLGSL